MIPLLLSVALADDCAKLDAADKQEIAIYLEAGVDAQRAGEAFDAYTSKAIALDKAGRLCTPQDKAFAASLLNTGFNPAQTKRSYELASEAMAEGDRFAVALVPLTYDRHVVAQGLPQRYATLEGSRAGKRCLFPVVDPASDTERKSFGLGTFQERLQAFGSEAGLGSIDSLPALGSAGGVCGAAPPDRGRTSNVGVMGGAFGAAYVDGKRPVQFGAEFHLEVRAGDKASFVVGFRGSYGPLITDFQSFQSFRGAVRVGLLSRGRFRVGGVLESTTGLDLVGGGLTNPAFLLSPWIRLQADFGPLYIAPEIGLRAGLVFDEDFFLPVVQPGASLAVGLRL